MWCLLSVVVSLNIVVLSVGVPDACTTCQCLPDSVYHGTLVKCSNLHLKNVPRLLPENATSVLLNGNKLTRTSGKMFQKLKELRKLDLSTNQLLFLNKHTFAGLGKLKELDLSSNKLSLSERTYTQSLFSPLKQLISLRINNNSNAEYLPVSAAYPDKSFRRLQSLQVLHLDGLAADFGPGFKNLVHLTNLSLSDNDGFCVLPVLRNSTFRNVPHLKYLNASNCLTMDTEPGTFTSLPNISVLDLSLNRGLGFNNFSKSTFGLQNSPLKLLKMNHLHPMFGSCSKLMIKHLMYLKHTPLVEIHIEGNGITELEQNVLSSGWKYLKTIYAGDNRFAYGIYIFELFEMKSLQNLYLQDIYGWHKKGPKFPYPVLFPTNIEVVDISRSYFRGTLYNIQHTKKSLKAFIAPDNLLEGLEGSFKTFHKLEYLDLSHNILTKFNRSVESLPLKYLNISHNYLGSNFARDIQGTSFSQLYRLEYLDISSNSIEYLSENAFADLISLKSLLLSDNKIDTFDHNLRHMKNLSYLDLSLNTLGNLGKNIQEDLDDLNNVTVNLANNVFSCICTNLQFLQWLRTYRSKIIGLESSHCKFSDGTLMKSSELDSLIDILRLRCVSYMAYFIISFSLFLLTILTIIIMIVYRYRWRLRYMYYVGRKTKLQNDEEIQYMFDGFVSYADEDRAFVKDKMIEELEDKAHLKLCIHHRDFIPGSVIASNVTNAIQNSKKTLIILSEDFLKSKWCDYEFHMARTEGVSRGKNVIVVVMYRRVSCQNMTRDMASFLAQYSYIQFEPTGNTDLFWSNITEAIKTDDPFD